MKITKLPYIFYSFNLVNKEFKKDELKEGEFTEYKINDKFYTAKKMNKFLFLTIKILPLFVYLGIFFNRYDFLLTKERIVQFTIGLIFALLCKIHKIGYLISAIGLIVFTITIFIIKGFDMTFETGYIIKYYILFFIVIDFIYSLNLKVFNLFFNNKIYGQLIK